MDAAIVILYFVTIFAVGLRARPRGAVTADEYFLSSRSLRWPSVAVSTIATNIHAGHFMGMAGGAYLFGLAQANQEINALVGIFMAAFFFVPLYLRRRVTTISQFFESKFGPRVALVYSILMMLLYGFMYLGSALFWAAWAADGAFSDSLSFLSADRTTRIVILIVALGLFSALYTALGGMRAVVRTDWVQFALLISGGLILVWVAVEAVGGWSQLWSDGRERMHLHLPSDHPTIPWTALLGMNLLNLNYWGANQIILQRALAAQDLRQAQLGLLVGGILKYIVVAAVIVPGIALATLHGENSLADPDRAYIVLLNELLPAGVRGLLLCGLFASLMSTVDSILNSISTLWSVDIYRRHLRPDAPDARVVAMAKRSIGVALLAGITFACFQLYVKTENPGFPLTHWFNELSYYAKNGFVLLIAAAAFLVNPSRRLVFFTLLASVALTFLVRLALPETNYYVRTSWVILSTFAVVAVPTWIRSGWRLPPGRLFQAASPGVARFGLALLGSLLVCHVVFH